MLDLAAKVAETSEQRYRLGAVVVKNGNVIAVGVNKRRNHPDIFESKAQIMRHASCCAERDALRRAGEAARGSTVYVARVSKSGGVLLARPCNRCYTAMKSAGVKTAYWTE